MQLNDRARAGKGGALAIHGEPGIGKTALLTEAVAAADGLRIIRVGGAESEMEPPTPECNNCAARSLPTSPGYPNPRRALCERHSAWAKVLPRIVFW